MNTQIKMEIELALREAEVIGMKFVKGDMTMSESEKLIMRKVNKLYEVVAGMEPKQESEIL